MLLLLFQERIPKNPVAARYDTVPKKVRNMQQATSIPLIRSRCKLLLKMAMSIMSENCQLQGNYDYASNTVLCMAKSITMIQYTEVFVLIDTTFLNKLSFILILVCYTMCNCQCVF